MDFIQESVAVLEFRLITLSFNVVPHVLLLGELLHCDFPMLINDVEFGLFLTHLFLNVFRGEDWFQVHPPSLGFYPVLKGVLNQDNSHLNLDSLGKDRLNERTRLHHEESIQVIV